MENNNLLNIYQILNEVLPNKVSYALLIEEKIELPIIVYQELYKRNQTFSDDESLIKVSTIQITLLTENKDINLERALEAKFKENKIEYNLISEFYLKKSGLHRIYEIIMEEIRNEQ